MTKRFSRLKYAIKLLQDPTKINDPDAKRNEPPEGSALDNFADFLVGKRKIEVEYPEDSRPGSIVTVAIRPFGLPIADANRFLVPISKRVADEKDQLVGKSHNHIDDTNGIVANIALTPAKAIIFRTEANANPEVKTSSITGLKYKRTKGVSFTLPFGAAENGSATHEIPARSAMLAARVGPEDNKPTISFEPEHFRGS